MANFLSISPNRIMFLPSVCLVPAGLFCHSCFNNCSLFKKVNNLYTFRFKVAKWAFSSLAYYSNSFQVNMFISRLMIQYFIIIKMYTKGKTSEKRDIKFLSFQICVVTNLSAPTLLLSLFLLFLGRGFPTAEF